MKELINEYTYYNQSIEIIRKFELERFFICRAFSISQIYRPNENPQIQIICLSPKLSCKLFIYQGDNNIIHEEEIQFSRHGLALVKLDSLPMGAYSVQALLGDRIQTVKTKFEVQEYKRSLLNAEVASMQRDGKGKIHLTVICKEFTGEEFNGKIRLTLNAIEFDSEIKNGMFSFSVQENKLGSDILAMNLIDHRGNTAELAIRLFNYNNTGLSLNNFGKRYKALSIPTENSKQALGFHITEESYEYDDWQIHNKDFNLISPIIDKENPFAKVEYIGDDKKYDTIEVTVLNLLENTETKVFTFQNPTRGSILSFPVSPPISVFNIRAYFTNKREDTLIIHSTVLFSENLDIKLDSLETIEPNQSLKLKISPSTACDIFVLAKPKTTKTNYAQDEIKSTIERFMDEGNEFARWNLGQKEIKINWIKNFQNHLAKILESVPDIIWIILFFPIWFPIWILVKPYKFVMSLFKKRRRLEEEEAAQQFLMREAPLRASDSMIDFSVGSEMIGGDAELDLETKLNQELEETFPGLKDKSRNLNESIIHATIHEIEKETTIEINGITDTGLIELYVFAVRGFYFTDAKKEVLSKKENYTIAEFPPLISAKEGASEASIQTITTQDELDLVVSNDSILHNEKTSHKKIHTIPLLNSGKYQVDIRKDKTVLDRFETNTSWIYESKILKSKLHILKAGDSLKGEKFWVYPSYANLTMEMVTALYDYPYGCAEQTLAGLYGNGMLYLKMELGEFSETKEFNRKDLKKRILFGQSKVESFINNYFPNYLWGLFDESTISESITAQCLLHLRPFYKSKISTLFPKLQSIAEKTKEALLKEGYKDNRLLSFDPKFKEDRIESPEAAASLILFDKNHDEEMEYLEKTKQENGVDIFWNGKSLAGKLQTTILVASALYKINSNLFLRVWNWISNQLEGNRFYSTSDTAEFLSLLFYLKKLENFSVIVDNEKLETKSLQHITPAKEIQVLEGELLVKEDWIEDIDYRKIVSNISFKMNNLPKEILFLSELSFEIEVENKNTTCLIARIATSGKLIFPNGIAQAVTSESPFKNGKVSFTLQAVHRGICEIQIVVYDLYIPELVGVSLENLVRIA
ncbi:MAG: hypothetical protein SFU98_06860 [Leptospiraceae bacterium]|nr:hypothetical protein [Leptospiraceae bacterium]